MRHSELNVKLSKLCASLSLIIDCTAEATHQLRVALNDLENALPRKSLLPQFLTNVAQDSSLSRIVLVEEVLERGELGAEAVEEVLREDPGAIGVGGFLNGVTGDGGEEGVVGQAVDERGLTHDLED